jgi:hypothetical protein
VRRAVAEEKRRVEKADRDALVPHILAQLLDASRGVPTLEATCAIVGDALKRVRAAEPAWDARRIAQNDECLRLAAVAYWTPERRDAASNGNDAKALEILDGWAETRKKGLSMNHPLRQIGRLLDGEDDDALIEASREAIRAAEAAGRKAFDEARKDLGIELGLQPFEADFLLACSPIGAVADLRRAYGAAFRLLAESGIIPKAFAASFPDGGNKTMDLDRLFTVDGLAAPTALGTGLAQEIAFAKEALASPNLTAGYTYLLRNGALFDLSPRRFEPLDFASRESLLRMLEAIGIAPAVEAEHAWIGHLRRGESMERRFFRYAPRPDGLTPILVTQPDRMEGNVVILAETAKAADPEWIADTWGAWNPETLSLQVTAHAGDRNGVRALMGPERHARHLALRAAADQGFEALLDALAKDG